MKIAFVYDLLYPWSVGGVEQRIFNLAKHLSHHHEVTLVGICPARGVRVHRWGARAREDALRGSSVNYVLVSMRGKTSLYQRGQRRLSEVLMYSAKLVKVFLKYKFDIIDCQNFPYFTAFPSKWHSLMKQSHLVLTWHEFFGEYWFKYMGQRGWIGKSVELMLTRLTRHHVCVSPLTALRLSRYVRKDAIKIIPNGIDCCTHVIPKRRLDKEHDLIFVGRLVPHKNVHVIIKLLPKLLQWNPGLSFVIVGEGPERRRLRRLSQKLGVHAHVKFVDFSTKEHVMDLIKRSKVLVLPSEREGFGIAAFEANTCRVPVFTLDFPWNAVAFYLRQGVLCGHAANPHDEASMCEKIKQLLQEKVHEINFDASRYDWGIISRTLESYYTRVLEK